MAALESDRSDENPFASPRTLEVMPAYGIETDPDMQELATVVGSKAKYYLPRWKQNPSSNQRGFGFNFGAFFFCGMWMAYRKMYRMALIFYGIILLITVAELILFVGIMGQAESPQGMDLIIGLGAGIICGSLGNSWYLKHARRIIAEVSEHLPAGDARLEVLRQRGGTNIGAALGVIVAYFGCMFFLGLAVALLMGDL